MNLLIPELKKRKEYLEKLQVNIRQQLKNMPQGKLRISNNQGIPRYYLITEPKDTRGTYIPKENQKLACELARKDYLNRLNKELQVELQDINTYLRKHGDFNLENIYTNMNDYRKNLITPLVAPEDLFVQKWKSESYKSNPYDPEQKVYPTKNGEMVRSKSEVLLADMYYELGIPYRYEASVQLKSGKKKYPDFTLLDKKTRQVVYHEHLGLMDEELYRKSNLCKLDEYRKNGIYPGKNLIITHEADGSYLNIIEIKQMVRELFSI